MLVKDLTTNTIETAKNTTAKVVLTTAGITNASSRAKSPNNVVNLIIGFNATDDVSLNGSPTVSPTTVAL